MAADSSTGALSIGLRLILRELRSQPSLAVTIFLATMVGVFVVAAAPRVTEEVSADDLRAAVTSPDPAVRNVRLETRQRIGAGPVEDPMARIRGAGDRFLLEEIPDSVKAVLSDHYFVVDSVRLTVAPMPGESLAHPFPVFVRYRYQEHVGEHFELIDGTLPTPQEPVPMLLGAECPTDRQQRDALIEHLERTNPAPADGDCALEDVPHLQMAVSAQTASDMGLEVGQQVLLTPDVRDNLAVALRSGPDEFPVVMSISGLIELTESSEEYWYGDRSLHRPSIQETADLRIIRATGLMAGADYRRLVRTLPFADFSYAWRHFVEPDLVASARIDQLEDDLRRLQAEFTPVTNRRRTFLVVTGLADLIGNHREQRFQTSVVLSTSVTGLLSVVGAVTLLLGAVMASRQSASVVLQRNRGASPSQLLLTKTYQGLMTIVPASVLGYGLAAWAAPGTSHVLPYRSTVVLAGLATTSIAFAFAPLLRSRLGSLQANQNHSDDRSGRAWVADLTIVLLAGLATVLLRRRGAFGGDEAGPDLLLAVAPTLLAVAAGVVTLRSYPIGIGLLAWIGSMGRGLVGFVGLRRILRPSAGARLALVVILICTSTAAFAAVRRTTLTSGQEVSSWQAVGADYSVLGSDRVAPLPIGDLDEFDGAEAAALGTWFPNAQTSRNDASVSAEVLAIDAMAYSDVIRGAPGGVDLPESMVAPMHRISGTDENPMRAVVAGNWPAQLAPTVGDVFEVDLGRLQPVVVVEEVRDRFPGITGTQRVLILDRRALQSFTGLPLSPTVGYLRAPESAKPALLAALSEHAPGFVLTSRYEFLAGMAEDPFVAWVDEGLGIVLAFSLILAALAATASVALGAANRRRDFGYLRAVGLTFRQARFMTSIEQLPALMAAVSGGALVGVWSAAILHPALDLDAFTGNVVATELHVGWTAILFGATILIGTLGLATVMFGLLRRGEDLGQTLRVGDQ